jgi:hypothetical protein
MGSGSVGEEDGLAGNEQLVEAARVGDVSLDASAIQFHSGSKPIISSDKRRRDEWLLNPHGGAD